MSAASSLALPCFHVELPISSPLRCSPVAIVVLCGRASWLALALQHRHFLGWSLQKPRLLPGTPRAAEHELGAAEAFISRAAEGPL